MVFELPPKWQKVLLVVASLGFIGLMSQSLATPTFVMVVLTVNFFTLAQSHNSPGWRQALLTINWGALPFGFYLLQTRGWVGVLSGNASSLSLNMVLFLGFPFYILSILAFNHDIQTGKIQRPSALDYILYGVYFPKFLSGPVEPPAFLQKLSEFRFVYDAKRWETGFDWVVLGMFCKFIVAQYLSRNVYWLEMHDLPKILLSVCAFELQVYFDLGGYSFMAYGVSRMLGLDLTLNFNHPFFSGDIRAFWQRWHISLGRWFFHYVYTPLRSLGPSSEFMKLSLPILIFLLSAVWHGQTLNFLVWGLWHGLAYSAYVKLCSRFKWPGIVGLLSILGVLLVGRMLFMETTFPYLLKKIDRLSDLGAWSDLFSRPWISQFDLGEPACINLVFATVLSGIFLAAEYRNQRLGLPPYAIFRRPWGQWLMIVAGILLIEGSPTGFIYARQ